MFAAPLRLIAGISFLSLPACSGEVRTLGPDQPLTPPTSASDPRASQIEGNAFQVSQGGRYFTWYGCAGCHSQRATGVRDLADRHWRHGDSVMHVYRAIAEKHGDLRYGARVPIEQLWQMTAYVRQLSSLAPERRRRQDLDQRGEPQAHDWNGPLR